MGLFLGAFCSYGGLPKGTIRLFFTSDRHGEIEPCGCQTGQIGGLDRLKNFLDIRRELPQLGAHFFLDTGDAFFALPPAQPLQKEDFLKRAKLVAHSFRKMALDVMGVGARDLKSGGENLFELKRLTQAQWVCSNLVLTPEAKSLCTEYAVLERVGGKVGVLSLLSDSESLNSKMVERVENPLEVTKRVVGQLKEMGVGIVVVLSHLDLADSKRIASVGGVSVVLGTESMSSVISPHFEGDSLLAVAKHEGQQVGEIVWDLESPQKSTYRLVDLDEAYNSENEISRSMKEYLGQRRLSALKVEKPQGKASSAGREFVAHAHACRGCHTEQYEFWERTHHSAAYLVLFSKNQHFDPECIGCHSLGYLEPGGYKNIAEPILLTSPPKDLGKDEVFVERFMKKVFGSEINKGPLDSRLQPDRYKKLHENYHQGLATLEKEGKIQKVYIGVQCEHCHGNRQGHPSSHFVKYGKVPEKDCKKCHTPPNDDDFDFKKMRPKVACPLMKKGEG